MHVIILAAGYGTRLKLSGKKQPKPLLRVGGLPILERQLAILQNIRGIQTVTIITNAKFHSRFLRWRRRYVQKHNHPYRINILNDGSRTNKTRLGPISDLAFALHSFTVKNDLLILGGDNAFEVDICRIIRIRKKQNTNLLGVHMFPYKTDVAGKYGVVILNKQSRLKQFEEKPCRPHSKNAATAIYLLRKQDIHEIFELNNTPHFRELNLGELIKHLLKKNLPVHCIDVPVWFDIGTKADLREANEYYLESYLKRE